MAGSEQVATEGVAQHRGAGGEVCSPASGASQPANTPACYLIVYNVAKRHNIGTLLRSASAFGVAEVCVVGSRQFNAFGAHGADAYLQYRHFASLDDCCAYLRGERGCTIVGVEIEEGAAAVHTHPYSGPTAFMLGNEGSGLNERQMRLCDRYVYIPQYGCGTASLNVTVAASIVLHSFAVWAGYAETGRHGQKFDVAERPQRTPPRGCVPPTEEERAAERVRRAAAKAAAAAAAGGGSGGQTAELAEDSTLAAAKR